MNNQGLGLSLAPRMKTRRITANIPEGLLQEATALSGNQGITETLVAGLRKLIQTAALEKAQVLRGKIDLQEDKGRRSDSPRD